VQRAASDKTTQINQAQAYAKQVVPEARGQAARVRAEAEGYKTSSIARAEGDASRFSQMVEQYKAAPDVTRKRLWLDTVQDVLSENRTIVGGDGRNVIYVPMGERRTPAPAPNSPLLTPDLLAPPTSVEPADTARPTRSPRSSGREEVTR